MAAVEFAASAAAPRSCDPRTAAARRDRLAAARHVRAAPGSPSSCSASTTTGSPRAWRSRSGAWTAPESPPASAAPGDHERRQQRRVEPLVGVCARAGAEVHEHQTPVAPGRRGPGGRRRSRAPRSRPRAPAPPARALEASIRTASTRARSVAITIALEPPSPTSRGIEVDDLDRGPRRRRLVLAGERGPRLHARARSLGETSSAAAGHANACARSGRASAPARRRRSRRTGCPRARRAHGLRRRRFQRRVIERRVRRLWRAAPAPKRGSRSAWSTNAAQ